MFKFGVKQRALVAVVIITPAKVEVKSEKSE